MIIYIRHGESTGEGSNPPLTSHGRAMAAAAAAWLLRMGYAPARFVTTSRRRSGETASIIAHAHGVARAYVRAEGWSPEIVVRAGAVHTPKAWDALAAAVGDGNAFVGHHPTQDLLVRLAGAPVAPKDHRCVVYAVERAGDGWRCVAHWEGQAKQR